MLYRNCRCYHNSDSQKRACPKIISIRYLELPPFDRCLSVVTFCQINLSRVSTPALSTPALSTLVISCRVVHCRVFSAPSRSWSSPCASISLHGWGGHTVANQPPTTVLLSFTFIPPPARTVYKVSQQVWNRVMN